MLGRLMKSIRTFIPRNRNRLKSLYRRVKNTPLERLPNAPDNFKVYRQFADHPELERVPGGWEFEGEFYPDYLTVGGAGHAIFPRALELCRGRGIDIGAGFWPLPGATPVDTARGPGASHLIEDFEEGSLDYVFSSHCLEHIEDWRGALREWIGKLKPGGVLFLYLPHPSCAIWRPGSPMVGEGHKWQPTPDVVREAVTALGCEVEAQDEGPDIMRSFHVAARKPV